MKTHLSIAVAGSLLVASACGCASGFSLKPKVKDVAAEQEKRHAEVVATFEQKRDAAQFSAAMVRWQERDIAGCRELNDKLLARNPTHRGGRLLRAEMNLLDEKPELALADIEKLVAENPQDAECFHMLALLLDASGRQAEALTCFEQATELAPGSEVFAASFQAARDSASARGSEVLISDAAAAPAGTPRSKRSIR